MSIFEFETIFYIVRYMLGKFLIVVAILAAMALMAIVNMTTPSNAGALGVLAVFISAYLLFLSFFTFFLWGGYRIIIYITNAVGIKRPLAGMSLRRSYFYSTILALIPIILISLQSVGGLGVYEIGLTTLLVVIGCVYVTKRQ